MPEVKVHLDKNGKPVRLEKIENDISHQLIEEFMLAANEVVARELKNRQMPAIYRVHEDPDADRLLEFRDFAKSYDYHVGDLTHRPEMQKLLAAVRGKPEAEAIKLGLLKSLKRAVYDISPLGHYGLAKVNYTHFTSPIRRYADLVVHRALALLTGEEKRARLAAGDLTAWPRTSPPRSASRPTPSANRSSSRSSNTSRICCTRTTPTTDDEPTTFPAAIVDVRNYGLLVELPDFVLSGLVHVSELDDDFYMFDGVRQRFMGKRTKQVYAIGDTVMVEVANVDMFKRHVDFRVAVGDADEEDVVAPTKPRRGRAESAQDPAAAISLRCQRTDDGRVLTSRLQLAFRGLLDAAGGIAAFGAFYRFGLSQVPFLDGDTWGYLNPALSKLTGGEFRHFYARDSSYPGWILTLLQWPGDSARFVRRNISLGC